MAKEDTPAALATPELPGLRRRGRPATGKAMTNAERQARYREKNRPRPGVPACLVESAAAQVRLVQDLMLDKAIEIGQLNPDLLAQVEGWYRKMHEIRQTLIGCEAR